mgnify:CR=1 FL=1
MTDDIFSCPTAQLNAMVEERMGKIRKSATAPKSQKVLKAMATAEISAENPDLTRAVIAQERQETLRRSFNV